MLKLIVFGLLSQAPAGRITAVVEPVRSTQGKVLCNLFDSAKGFPGKATLPGRHFEAKRVEGRTVCEFEAVEPGTYAIVVIHDENTNDKLDTNFIGIPTEGYGVSNNILPKLSAPTWEDSRFTIAAGEQRRLTVTLKY